MHADVLRILDVSLNRARESLRVIEDYARFVLDDRAAAAEIKRCRHDLLVLVHALGADELLASRDILGDVGQETKTASELDRDALDDVLRAAFGRLGEAARSLGEYAKLTAAPAAKTAESLRYQAYELEQRIVLRGRLRQDFAAVRLYVLLTEALCKRPWREVAEAALRGGAGCIQLREKGMADRELLQRARWLRDLTARHEALLCINDRADLARLAAADAVHLGQDDLSVREARRIGSAALLVGKSTHTPAQFASALAEQPDYVAVGPMFAGATKPQEHVAGVETLRACAELTELPIAAIGGITPATAEQIFRAGASCVCVCAAVIGADDPEEAARALLK